MRCWRERVDRVARAYTSEPGAVSLRGRSATSPDSFRRSDGDIVRIATAGIGELLGVCEAVDRTGVDHPPPSLAHHGAHAKGALSWLVRTP